MSARTAVCASENLIGWDRCVGAGGPRIGMRTFGAPAPIKDLLTKFGITPEKVLAAAAKAQIANTRRQAK